MQAVNAKRHHLYRITNLLNGKVYIGQAIKINKRWSSHKTASKACGNSNRKPKQYISSAMHVHGIDNFVFEQIASGTISCTCKPHLPGELFELEPCKIAVNILEDELIVQYDCLKINGKGYNIARGGQSGPMSLVPSRKGIHNSPTTEFKNGHKLSSESLQKMSNSLKGRIIPLEHKSILLSNLNNGGGRYRFTKGHIPWNKDLKGMLPFKPNTKLTKIPWANDQKLTELATQHGLTATAKMFGTTSSLLHARLKSRGITIIRSKINLGTFTNGSNHKMSILKEEQVLEIVKLYHSGNYSQQELGDQFGVSRLTISGITNGQNWSHLTKIQPGQPKFRRSGFRTGSKHHMAILNDKQVLEIIKLIADKNYTYAEIGKQFGVKRNSIKNIACGKAWSHLTGIIPKTKKKSP